MAAIRELARRPGTARRPTEAELGRNLLTRTVDRLLAALATISPQVHSLAAILTAVMLYLYARIVAATLRLTVAGASRWPEVGGPAVLVLWHGCAPSLLVALAARPLRRRAAIMVAAGARGDCLEYLCRWLGLAVVRGDDEHSGWAALAEIASEVEGGACAVITADGTGPARVAKTGALALAAAARVPLIAVGAACRPALVERRKWDEARNPVPFGRVAVVLGDRTPVPVLASRADLEAARRRLRVALDEVTATAARSIER